MRYYMLSLACLLAAVLSGTEPFRCPDERALIIPLEGEWLFKRDDTSPDGVGFTGGWFKTEHDDQAWASIRIGQSWESQGHAYNGVAWYRQRVVVPAAWKGQEIILCLGRPDDNGTVWWNGEQIFTCATFGAQVQVRLDPAKIRFGEENVIAAMVIDRYKNGGLNYGDFALRRIVPFSMEMNPAEVPLEPLRLSVTHALQDDIFSNPRWQPGWRDGGTSDTRPRMSAARGAYQGQDAVVMQAWYPNSSEFVDCTLAEPENGDAWARRGDQYLSFMVQSDDTEGEFLVCLNRGKVRWGSKGTVSYFARVNLVPGAWQQVILPFTAFKVGSDGKFTNLVSTADLDTISLGYRNHELQRPGAIRFADFQTGRFSVAPAGRPISLDGLWRFRLDNIKADGTPLNQKDDVEKQGVGAALGFHTAEFDDSQWGYAAVGRTWEDQGYDYNGAAWFRTRVMIPEGWRGRPVLLDLGQPDDRGEVWVNGVQVAAIEKFGPAFRSIAIPAEVLRIGALNVIAVRVVDWYMKGGLLDGPFAIGPSTKRLVIRELGKPATESEPATYEMGAHPDKALELVLRFAGTLSARDDLEVEYRLKECFHRTIAAGRLVLTRTPSGELEGVLPLTGVAARRLYYGEIFNLRGVLRSRAAGPLSAFDWADQKLRYAERDQLALPALPEQYEDTPYGRLKLVDVIDCAANSWQDAHPYKEGGIRDSWVGRRAYSTWLDGIAIKEHQSRRYREANNNEHFLYRIGRGEMKPHQAYLLRVLFPDNAKRYMAVDIKAGRNYNGTGFRSGAGVDDPLVNYPQSNAWQWMDNFVINDDRTYGSEGPRKASSKNGFWVAFHDIGRCYAPEFESGPAVAEMRLYEIPNAEALYPHIRLPQGQPQRVLMTDWEREPEISPQDMARHARLLGLNAVAPVFQKWASMAFFQPTGSWSVPAPDAWNSATEGEGENSELYERFLAATKAADLPIIPRIEYGGSPTLAKEARVIGPDGNIDPSGRFSSWGANILHPNTWAEMETLIDDLVGKHIAAYPHIGGLLWRMRNDRIKVSYGPKDVELFCRETGTALPQGDGKALAKWASGKMARAYQDWWHGKHRDFLVRIRDKLRSIRPDLQLYYYNWDGDGWNMGPTPNAFNKAEDWSDYYNVDRAKVWYERISAAQRALKDTDYVNMLGAFNEPHRILRPDLFAKIDGIHLFAPVHWRYLADNAPYLEHFRTGAGLAMCNMFNYEEKGRWNVHHDNYETSEMVPGGHDFAMAEEVLACFHADPQIITWTTYTFGRAFVDVHRRFAQAYRALPAVAGTVLAGACANPEVRVRSYPGQACTYIGVVHKGVAETLADLRLPISAVKVTDLVTGKPVPFTIDNGVTVIAGLRLAAMELNSMKVE